MKEKILPFIIGVLVGAIIATGGYYLYSKSTASNKGGMPNGNPPEMMQQNGNSIEDKGTPPEKPADDGNGSESTQQDNSNSSSTKKNKNKNTNTNSTNSSESSNNSI